MVYLPHVVSKMLTYLVGFANHDKANDFIKSLQLMILQNQIECTLVGCRLENSIEMFSANSQRTRDVLELSSLYTVAVATDTPDAEFRALLARLNR